MIVQRRTAFTGILLCSILFSLSVPLLLGIAEIPEKSFGQDILTLSQASSADPLREELAQGLKKVEGVEAVSAEIYAFSAIGDEPVFIRGVVLSDYIAMEGAKLHAQNDTWRFAVVGTRLASRLGVQIGSRVVLTGSVLPKVMELEITGTYSIPSGGNDLLVPLWIGRALGGLGDGMVHTIRVKAKNMSTVAGYLESTEGRLVLTTGGGVSTPINTNATSISTEERLVLRYLDAATFKASNGSYISIFVQEGAQNVQVVVVGFIVLEGVLTFVGSIAVMSRVLAHRRQDIGTLGAIGATRGRIVGTAIREALPTCAAASVAGVLLGSAMASVIDRMGVLVVFGQTVTPVFTTHLILLMLGAMLSLSIGASAVSAWVHASARPERTMRESGEETFPFIDMWGLLGVKNHTESTNSPRTEPQGCRTELSSFRGKDTRSMSADSEHPASEPPHQQDRGSQPQATKSPRTKPYTNVDKRAQPQVRIKQEATTHRGRDPHQEDRGSQLEAED